MRVVEEQELPQMDLEPEMGAAAAAVHDTSPSLLHQNPPMLAESAQPSAPDIAQLIAMLAAMNANMENKMDGIKNNTNGIKEEMKEEMKKMRGEMRQIGRGLQAGTARMLAITGKMVTPRAATNELQGSAPAGEDRVIRETCWARREEVTETVTRREKLNGVTETCTAGRVRQVTELTGTREVEKKRHSTDEVKAAHTHTELARDDEGERERVETRCGQLGVLPRERREALCPLEAGHGQVNSVMPREVEGVSAADGCTRSLGGVKTPGALEVARVPSVCGGECGPGVRGVAVRVHQCGKMRAATHA